MIKTNPLSVSDIEKLARSFRETYNINEDTFFPIFEIIEKLHYNNMLTYQIVENDQKLKEEGIIALYVPTENFIYIKDSVLEEYENNNYRASFTLCHELFHYIQAQILNFDFEEVETCKSYEDVDWQANEFAGQLLIPSKYVSENEELLMEKFHVSIECVLTRKAKLKKRQKK